MCLDERIKAEIDRLASLYNADFDHRRFRSRVDYQNSVASRAIDYVCNRVGEEEARLRHAYIKHFYRKARGVE